MLYREKIAVFQKDKESTVINISVLTEDEKNRYHSENQLSAELVLVNTKEMPKTHDELKKWVRDKSRELNLYDLSIGMSGDYEKAILNGSTYLRLGTAIFGARST